MSLLCSKPLKALKLEKNPESWQWTVQLCLLSPRPEPPHWLRSLCSLCSSHTGLAFPWMFRVCSCLRVLAPAAPLPGVFLSRHPQVSLLSLGWLNHRQHVWFLYKALQAPEVLPRRESVYQSRAKRRRMVAGSFLEFTLSRSYVYLFLMFSFKNQKF